MGIQISFDTDDLSDVDVKVLGALARSLGDPDWAETAEKPKRPAGRPRMTDEEKAEAARQRAEKKAAEEKAAKDEAEAAAEEKAAAEQQRLDAARAAKAEKAAEEPAPEPEAAEEPEAEPEPAKPAPKPEKAAEEPEGDDEDDTAEAVRLATSLVHDGRGAEVRNALKDVDAKRVSDLKGKSLDGFLKIVRDL